MHHISLVDACIDQVPPAYRRDLLFTCDGAGSTQDLVKHLTDLDARRGYRVHYSVGWDLSARERTAIAVIPDDAWQAVLDADGRPRDLAEAAVAELTGLLRHGPAGDQLASWPTDARVLVRREKPSSSAIASGQLSLFELAQGRRFEPFATNTPTGGPQFLEARHRPHARVEARTRCAKAAGLHRFPSTGYTVNTAWAQAIATIAADLTAWTQLLALDGELAKAEPKKLRHRLLHTAAQLTRGQRRRRLNIDPNRPWARQCVTAFTTIKNLPQAAP